MILTAEERSDAIHLLAQEWEYEGWSDERWAALSDGALDSMTQILYDREVLAARTNIVVRETGTPATPLSASEQWLGAPQPVDYQFTAGGGFILDQPATVPAIWGSGDDVLWSEGESLMIAGGQGLGKTTMAGLLIRAQIRGGGTVLGLPVVDPGGRILYLAMDRPRQAARAFARQFTADDRDALNDRLVVWPGPPPADIAQNPALLNELAESADADVVYLDSVKDAAIGLSDDAVGAGYNRARQTLIASGRQVCDLHHIVKRGVNGAVPSGVADIYGSTWLTSGAGSVILLTGDPGDPIIAFRHVKQPAAEVGPWRLSHDHTAGSMSIEHDTDLLALATAGGPNGITALNAAIALFSDDKPGRSDVEKARRKLDKLVESGLLVRVEGARGGPLGSRPASYFPAS